MEPLYKNVYKDLLNKVSNGFYKQGETIPTELELAELYQVSRPTIRQAVQLLVNDGYLEKRKKRGTIVCSPKIQQEFTQVIESFDDEMKRKGLIPKTKVISFRIEKANEEVCNALELEENEEVYKLTRLRFTQNQPNVLVITYIPCRYFPNLLDVDFTSHRLYNIFHQQGMPIESIKRKLETISADDTVADLLDINSKDPIFYFHSTGYTKNRIPIEYSISKYRGDINSFVFELSTKSV